MNEVGGSAPYRVAPSYGLEKCPHCEGLTAAQPSTALQWVCGVCGKPVIPGVDATKLDPPTRSALLAAADALAGKNEARGGVVFLYFLLVAAAASALGARFLLASAALAVALLALFVRLMSARERRLKSALIHLEDARLHVAALLARERAGHLTASELAETIRIALPDAELLLTRLSVDRGRVDYGTDTDRELHYRVDAEAPLPSQEEMPADPASPAARRASRE